MRVLIDTHVLLWWLTNDAKLSTRGAQVRRRKETVAFVSAASLWELRIKQGLGKVALPDSFADELRAEHFEILSIHPEHAHAAAKLPQHHRDPFDRMLVAQATLETLTVMTHDQRLAKYDVTCLLV
jgi:PIN domain nuclease of toxin-antitoxin system